MIFRYFIIIHIPQGKNKAHEELKNNALFKGTYFGTSQTTKYEKNDACIEVLRNLICYELGQLAQPLNLNLTFKNKYKKLSE